MSLDLLTRGVNYAGVEEQFKSLFNSMLAADWRQAFIARGYGWHFDVGALTTPITGGGAGTTIALQKPEFCISVASGYTIVPIEFNIACRPGLATTDSHTNDILIAADRAAAWAGDGTVTAETPTNMRTSITSGCPATCFSAATANITAPTLGIELARATKLTDVQGTAATVNLQELWLKYEPRHPQFLVGPAAIYGYFGGSIAVTGFAQLSFLVIPSSLITGLS